MPKFPPNRTVENIVLQRFGLHKLDLSELPRALSEFDKTEYEVMVFIADPQEKRWRFVRHYPAAKVRLW